MKEGAAYGQGLGGLIGQLFGSSSNVNPFSSAAAIGRQYWPEIHGYKQQLMPYASQYEQAMSGLMNDPSALVDHIMSHYHESPFAHDMTDQAQRAANAAAARGGFVGTPQEQEAVARRIGQISDADQNQYLQNVLGQYRLGASGLRGLQSQIPELLGQEGQYFGNMAGLAADEASFRNRQREEESGGIGSLIGEGIGGLIGHFL